MAEILIKHSQSGVYIIIINNNNNNKYTKSWKFIEIISTVLLLHHHKFLLLYKINSVLCKYLFPAFNILLHIVSENVTLYFGCGCI